jgi:hypothetical protein
MGLDFSKLISQGEKSVRDMQMATKSWLTSIFAVLERVRAALGTRTYW